MREIGRRRAIATERSAAVREAEAIVDLEGTLLGDRAYRTIKRGIIERRWAPGDVFSEQALASELGMSRTPIREAFRALRRDGLVQTVPGRGTFVTSLSGSELRQLYEYREALEGQAARLAAERATTTQLEDLAAIDRRGRRATSPDELVPLGIEFHELIARSSGNDRISEELHGLEHQTRAARILGFRLMPHIWTEHSGIAHAIAERDADLAEGLARAHIRAARNRLFAL
jgi:DNA-binding GntR family transcriptional regulator